MTRLIVALDMSQKNQVLSLIDEWDPTWCVLKIGLEAFTRFGPDFVRLIVARGFRVFLDLKFHDIPNTVAASCQAAADLGVWMLNVHAAGGLKMMQAAQEALNHLGSNKPYLMAVTVLTSQETSEQDVIRLARCSQAAGLDGVVCAALEVPAIKQHCGASFLTVTPGIRLKNETKDDQKRVVTFEQACQLGSDYAVMGRSILRSPNPTATLKSVLSSCN